MKSENLRKVLKEIYGREMNSPCWDIDVQKIREAVQEDKETEEAIKQYRKDCKLPEECNCNDCKVHREFPIA